MKKFEKFLRKERILRLATLDKKGNPHLVPVWYMYQRGRLYIGTNTRTKKVKNIKQQNKIAFCIDVGINSPDIFGVMGTGKANLVLEEDNVKRIAKRILLRYFKSLKKESARTLLDDTNCIIEIIPKKIKVWNY